MHWTSSASSIEIRSELSGPTWIDSVTLSVYGKNLTDTSYRQSALFLGAFETGFQDWAAPRIYAAELMYRR